MTNIQKRLFELQDEKYADFQSRLIPGIPKDSIIGVRVPALRQIAKLMKDSPEAEKFMRFLPHKYYDENMLHALLLSELKDYFECAAAVKAFLPYIDNWAVCDILSPKSFRRHRAELIEEIKKWTASEAVYSCRFGIGMLMTHFLGDAFKQEYLNIPASVSSSEYYVNMMIAWFFATALAKQWDAAIGYIENGKLGDWVRNKTIQKAVESRRISPAQKEYLRQLRA